MPYATHYSPGRRGARTSAPRPTVDRPMPRAATVHVCSACGAEAPRWMGQCPGCGEWNTLVEERAPAAAGGGKTGGGRRAGALRPVALADVPVERVPRMQCGIGELDRVLGGGLVP